MECLVRKFDSWRLCIQFHAEPTRRRMPAGKRLRSENPYEREYIVKLPDVP